MKRMNLFQRLAYKVVKPLNKWLTGVVYDLEITCDHKKLNGESALIKTQYNDECTICGHSWINDETYDNLARAYRSQYDEI